MNYNFAHDTKTHLGTAERLFHDLHCGVYDLTKVYPYDLAYEELSNGWVICRDITGSVTQLDDARQQIGIRLTEARLLMSRTTDEQKRRWQHRTIVYDAAYTYLTDITSENKF